MSSSDQDSAFSLGLYPSVYHSSRYGDPHFMFINDSSGFMVYRDVIPLAAAVECIDTSGDDFMRQVSHFSDIFVKVVKGPSSAGVFIICHLSPSDPGAGDVEPPLPYSGPLIVGSYTNLLGTIGTPQVLTRVEYSEIQSVSREGPCNLVLRCVPGWTSQYRRITLDFFLSDHRMLFEFASCYTYTCNPGRGFPYDVHMEYESISTRLEHAAIQLGISVSARADNIWTMVRHIADDRVIRDIYPFYTHQMVWLSDVSPGLQAWLDSGAAQGHFLVGTQGDDDIRSHMHHTPIEAAIDSMIYGWGTWMRSDTIV